MESETLTEKELERMRKLDTYRKVVTGILVKRWWIPFAVFFGFAAAALLYFASRSLGAVDRYEARTNLLFYPKQASKIKSMEERQVAQVITRNVMFGKLADSMQFTPEERARLRADIEIRQERGTRDMFSIYARGRTEDSAIAKANAFADLCLREYVVFRMADLESWLGAIQLRKKELSEQISALDTEEAELGHKFEVSSPQQDADRLNASIQKRKGAASEVAVQIHNEETKSKKFSEELSAVSPGVISHADELRQLQQRLQEQEAELARLRLDYTDSNPKVALALQHCEETRSSYRRILDENGVKTFDQTLIKRLDVVAERYRESQTRLEQLRERAESLDREIAHDQELLRGLVSILPNFERIQRHRTSLEQTVRGLEETVSDIRYLQASVSGDFTQVERAIICSSKSPFSVKNLALGMAAGLFSAGVSIILVVIIGFLFGRIGGAGEVKYHPEFTPLGALPWKSDFWEKDKDAKYVADRIYYRFRENFEGCHVLLSVVIAGGRRNLNYEKMMLWNIAMSGTKLIRVKIVPADKFVIPEKGEQMGGIFIDAEGGYFPVANPMLILPSEMQLLERDLQTLAKTYDIIVLSGHEPMRRIGVLARQLVSLCDATIIYLGANFTPRRLVRRLAELQHETGRKIMTVVTGERKFRAIKEAE